MSNIPCFDPIDVNTTDTQALNCCFTSKYGRQRKFISLFPLSNLILKRTQKGNHGVVVLLLQVLYFTMKILGCCVVFW